ncbi:MAG: WG repeat-containing protein [Chitinophagaceae bacterium]|nr:WG repeat-containing protein [Chitinophagaceae bacterium]
MRHKITVGLIDSKGRKIIDFNYESILYMAEDRVWAAKNGKWGVLDNKGKALSPFIYQAAYALKEALHGWLKITGPG